MGETILIDMKELSNLVLTPRAGNLAVMYIGLETAPLWGSVR